MVLHMAKIDKNKFNAGAIIISETQRKEIMDTALHNIQDKYMGRYPDNVFIAIRDYGYTRLAKDLNRSTEAVSKWFRLSRIPASLLSEVANKLNVPVEDFTKEFRG